MLSPAPKTLGLDVPPTLSVRFDEHVTTNVPCPHFRIGLEAAAGEHHSAGPDRDRRALVFRDDAREPPVFTDETGGGRLCPDGC